MKTVSDWFDLWGHIDHDRGDNDITELLKISEFDLVHPDLTAPERVVRLWLRFLACHGRLSDSSRRIISEDLGLSQGQVNRALNRLLELGELDCYSGTWLTDKAIGHVYFIQAGDSGPIKIGKAVDVEQRISQLQTAQAERLTLLGVIPHGGVTIERELHNKFSMNRLQGEWFYPSPELNEYIRKHSQQIS